MRPIRRPAGLGFVLLLAVQMSCSRTPQAFAIVNLLQTVERYPELRFVAAACHLKTGDLYEVDGDRAAAERSYALVVADERPGMAAYRQLAEMRLRTVHDGSTDPSRRRGPT